MKFTSNMNLIEDSFKEFRMQIEIIAVIFDLISSNE